MLFLHTKRAFVGSTGRLSSIIDWERTRTNHPVSSQVTEIEVHIFALQLVHQRTIVLLTGRQGSILAKEQRTHRLLHGKCLFAQLQSFVSCIAVISIDQVMHGARLESGSELTLFFNFQNPLSAQTNVMQAAIDDFQLLRLVEDLTVRHEETGELLARFDADKINFFGHSQGSNTGVPFVALEPKIKGAVFSGAGGLLFLSLLTKTEPYDITAILALLIREKPLDRFNPILSILQAYFEPADSAAYGPLLVKKPAPGNGPKNVYQLLGWTDRFTPPVTIEALATAIGVDMAGPAIESIEGLELSGKSEIETPIQNNAGEVTAVVSQFNEASGSDGHFVAFDIDGARTQSIMFIKTLVETGTATVVTP